MPLVLLTRGSCPVETHATATGRHMQYISIQKPEVSTESHPYKRNPACPSSQQYLWDHMQGGVMLMTVHTPGGVNRGDLGSSCKDTVL